MHPSRSRSNAFESNGGKIMAVSTVGLVTSGPQRCRNRDASGTSGSQGKQTASEEAAEDSGNHVLLWPCVGIPVTPSRKTIRVPGGGPLRLWTRRAEFSAFLYYYRDY